MDIVWSHQELCAVSEDCDFTSTMIFVVAGSQRHVSSIMSGVMVGLVSRCLPLDINGLPQDVMKGRPFEGTGHLCVEGKGTDWQILDGR